MKTTTLDPAQSAALDAVWADIQQTHPEANFLQSPAWGRMHQILGRKVIVEHFGDAAWCQMIVRDAKRGRYLEIPCGPLLDWDDSALVRRMFTVIRKVAKAEKCVFVRLRPQLRATEAAKLAGLGLKKAPMHLAAEHTVILDLTQSEDDLLKHMRRQTRYEVRRASKLGITVTSGNSKKLFQEFQSVQAETASRQHFIPPALETLLAEREAFGDNALIYVAKTGPSADDPDLKPGQPIAYGLILISGVEAEYFEAASTELNHRLPGAYALQWQVMRDLKARGVERYNLWGIAPPGQPHHRYAGVTTFKTGFGGEVVEFVSAQDLPIKHCHYLLDWLFEMIRKKKRHL